MRKILAIAFMLLLGFSAEAQKLDHSIDFSFYFDNRELDRGGEAYTESMTLFAARLTPYIGLRFDADRHTVHRIMAGVDIYKDMGDGLKNVDLFDEMSLFYEYGHLYRNGGKFQMVAGVLPRSYSEGNYSRAIFSDATLFTDHNIEGLLLKYRNRKLYSELYCDWMGKYGHTSRERFQINTAGEFRVFPVFSLGWDASLYHYSCSEVEHYVVDNAMANIYGELDLSKVLGMQAFSVKTGLLTGYQRDRRQKEKTIPTASESILTVGMWNFGIEDTFVYSPDMMVYYDDFGSELYLGSPFYHTGTKEMRPYNRLEIYWGKRLNRVLSLKVSAVAHFADSPEGQTFAYQGMQQRFSLRFDLGSLK